MEVFSDLTNVEKVSVVGHSGGTLLPLLVAIPRLKDLSWDDVLFAEENIAYDGLTALQCIQFSFTKPDLEQDGTRRSIDPEPWMEAKRANSLLQHILASSETLSHITLDYVAFDWRIPEGSRFPSLTEFTLIDPICQSAFSPNQTKLFPMAPRLKSITIRRDFFQVVLPRVPILRQSPALVSLTIHNVDAKDGILFALPITLRFLSLSRDPYPPQPTMKGSPPREVWEINDVPQLALQDSLMILKTSRLMNLEELRLSIRGVVSPKDFVDFIRCLPKLKIFELHNWRHEPHQPCYSILDFTETFARLQTLQELRLDMHLVDDLGVMESCIDFLAILGPTSLRRIGYLVDVTQGQAPLSLGYSLIERCWYMYELVPNSNNFFQAIRQAPYDNINHDINFLYERSQY
ncbi:hypothetical protein M422DRAFT_25700 [Sphaerobolus stellatus SS14]|nr:hypothetical protein M422DRAFT_25700 [Sphaerobolus stellatus SS14]